MTTAVLFSAGTPKTYFSGETEMVYWESPSTMDSADTVVLPSIQGKTIRIMQAWDHTTGDAVTCTISTATITVDAAGATTDHTYGIWFHYV